MIKRLAGHEQGERRVESAAYADGHRRPADLLQPARQTGDLCLEDFLAALAQLLGSTRHERVGFDIAGKTVGVVGTGKIGAVVARIMTGFGCRVVQLMTIQGLGFLTPVNLLVCLELQHSMPDLGKISRWMRWYFYSVALQGSMQVAIIIVMTRFRMGL